MGKSTVSNIIRETFDAIYEVLVEKYLCPPSSPADWIALAKSFEEQWNLPHVIGALDGKHIRIQCPEGTGTLFHNYKGYFSIVLLAVCDASYNFTLIDIGQYGSNNDSGVLARSEIGQRFASGSMHLPAPATLEGCCYDPLPYYLLGDEIFPLKTYLMRPYPGKKLQENQAVYNYRHSRARRVIENTFGILVSRWRIFNTPINATVENTEKYVKAAIVLHNYLRQTENAAYCPAGFIDSERSTGDINVGNWRNAINVNQQVMIQDLPPVRGSRYRKDAVEMRDALKGYVNSEEGELSWQLEYVRRT